MSTRLYTVVFAISDEAAWEKYGSQFTASMNGDGPVHIGVEVTACGEGDAMTQADALSEAVMEIGYDPDEVISEYAEEHGLHPQLILG